MPSSSKVRLRVAEETQASVGNPRGRASERREEYMFRTKHREWMNRPSVTERRLSDWATQAALSREGGTAVRYQTVF